MRILTLILLLCFTISGNAADKKREKRQLVDTVPVVYGVWNVASNELIDSKNESEIHSMASITKLMTVLVVLDSGVNLQEALVITGREGSSKIRTGMLMTRGELIDLALVGSDNLAARTLAEAHPGGYDHFIDLMNDHARRLGMVNTRYSDATGLTATNVTTAQDLVRLVLSASRHNIYQEAAMKDRTQVHAVFKRKTQTVVANNTNQFAGKLDIQVAKTGFTNAAGRCLTMLYRWGGQTYALVVMGAHDPAQRRRIVESLIAKTTRPSRQPPLILGSNTLVLEEVHPDLLTIK